MPHPMLMLSGWHGNGRRLARASIPILNFARLARALALSLLVLAPSLVLRAQAPAPRWEAVEPEDLASTTSTASPGADSEYLFWRTSIVDLRSSVTQRTRVRAKIYTARGVENAGKLSFETVWAAQVSELAARVVKRDGTIVELKESDFVHSEFARFGKQKIRRTAVAFPSLEPGDIIEYRWSSSLAGDDAGGWYFCQQEVPVREYVMDLTPRINDVSVTWGNVTAVEKTNPVPGRVRIVARNLPAYVDEPAMPPPLDSRGWLFVTYTGASRKKLTDPWNEYSTAMAKGFAQLTKPTDAVRKQAAQLVAGVTDDEEKIRRLHEFCRLEIKHLEWDSTTRNSEREKFRMAVFPSVNETLKRRRGWEREVNTLFAAMLRSIGLQPRHAECAPTPVILNSRAVLGGWNFHWFRFVALQRDGRWKFYDPGSGVLPPGLPERLSQGAIALIAAEGEPVFEKIDPAPATHTVTRRTARFTLDAEGVLQGEVEVTLSGHEAVDARRRARDEPVAELERELGETLRQQLTGAEVTNVSWDKLQDLDGSVVQRYRVTVPAYAELTGQRWVVVPSFFTRGRKPAFVATERTHALFWPGAWTEEDEVEIALPPDREPEQPNAPAAVASGDNLLSAHYGLRYDSARHALVYERRVEFRADRAGQQFPRESYPAILQVFTQLAGADQHSIVLRPRGTAANATASGAAAGVSSGPAQP